MVQYLVSKYGMDFLEIYYHCRYFIHYKWNIPFLFYIYI